MEMASNNPTDNNNLPLLLGRNETTILETNQDAYLEGVYKWLLEIYGNLYGLQCLGPSFPYFPGEEESAKWMRVFKQRKSMLGYEDHEEMKKDEFADFVSFQAIDVNTSISVKASCEAIKKMSSYKTAANIVELLALNRIWCERSFTLKKKMQISKAWLTKQSETTNSKEAFDLECLREMLEIKWREHVINEKLRSLAKLPSEIKSIEKGRLKWFSHIIKMNKAAAKTGVPRMTWRQAFIRDLDEFNLSYTEAEKIVSNKKYWLGVAPFINMLCRTRTYFE